MTYSKAGTRKVDHCDMAHNANFSIFEDLLLVEPPLVHIPDVGYYSIYGAGELGQLCLDLLLRLDKNVVNIYDHSNENAEIFRKRNQLQSAYDTGQDIPVIACISKFPHHEVMHSIRELRIGAPINFYDFADFFSERTSFQNGWRFDGVSASETIELKNLFKQLEDNTSVDHLFEFLHWHRLRRGSPIPSFNPEIQDVYFPHFLSSTLNSEETFVDIGSHSGAVIAEFDRRMHGSYVNIFGIEPDPFNFSKAVNKLSNLDNRIRLIGAGVGAKTGLTSYAIGRNYLSAAASETGTLIPEFRLDDLGLSPSFLKVHTEGCEAKVLSAGIQTLQKHRPIIATTVYHRRRDLFEVAKLLFDQMPDYRFYFRCHSYVGASGVLYALPKERF